MWLRFNSLLFCLVVAFPTIVHALAFEPLKAGVVNIMSEFESGKRKVGTGFIIRHADNEAYIITASHVIEDANGPRPKMNVTFYPDKLRTFSAEIKAMQSIVDNPRGLAVLRVTGQLPEGIETLKWGTSDALNGGESVDFIGFPRFVDTPWAVTNGRVSGWKGEYLTLSGTIDEGNSGGPIFLNGQVVGVVMENQGAFSYGVPASRVGRLAKNWGILSRWPPVNTEVDSLAKTPSSSKQAEQVSLTIHSSPANADVLIDDVVVGKTSKGSLTLKNLDADEYEITVRKDGFTSWRKNIEVHAGESRSLRATLEKSGNLNISGTWRTPADLTLSYIFEQNGDHIVMKEVTTNLYGSSITAQGEGQISGNVLNIFYSTILGTNGRSQAVVAADGKSMQGSYQDLSTGLTLAISLVRASE
ncbi:trypsin-like peptidase domain-containing protein [Candidatus Nitrospira salsa]|nr:MAG: hypothetical protein NPIRA01_27540 [Nitrospirales bacterium]